MSKIKLAILTNYYKPMGAFIKEYTEKLSFDKSVMFGRMIPISKWEHSSGNKKLNVIGLHFYL